MFAEDTHVATNRGVLSDEVAFLGDTPTQWCPFDFEAVERNLGELPPEPEPEDGPEDIAELLRLIWVEPGNLALARERFNFMARLVLAQPGTNRGTIGFEKLILWCYLRRTPATPFRRFCAMTATIDPKLVAGKSYAALAKELRVTKSSVSANARDFRDHFSFYFHEYRPAAGRAHMRAARLSQRLPNGRVVPRNVGKLKTAPSPCELAP
jgi:hypothetical protein